MTRRGDADLSVVARLLADPSRCRMLLALDDGRALPASRLAGEAGVSAATASSHLGKLVDAGFLTVEPHGRHRYYRLSGPEVGRLLEMMATLAPASEIHSLREDTRARALREARTCYDHIAGRLGVAIMRSLLVRRLIAGGDGQFHPGHAGSDRLSAYGHEVDYQITSEGFAFLDRFGVAIPPRRPVVRYCVDWSEQAHHLAGGVGRGLLDRMLELDWIARRPDGRALDISDAGLAGLAEHFSIELEAELRAA
ncbi:MAG TPA: winged helix-turn-helix domain-containing protein [Solirubrobacteraceae bacterium]|nr:winged helix-turn-helix domain-containing protein [Solirubrobacteraceae bacterium]